MGSWSRCRLSGETIYGVKNKRKHQKVQVSLLCPDYECLSWEKSLNNMVGEDFSCPNSGVGENSTESNE